MHRAVILLSSIVLAFANCHREGPPRAPRASGSAAVASAAPQTAPPAPAPQTAPSALAPQKAPFEVVDVLDFGRRDVRSFAFSSVTQQLFVSFTDRLDATGDNRNELFQYDLAAGKGPFLYSTEPNWIFDRVHVLPGGRRVVAGQYKRSKSHLGAHWERFALIDPENRRVLSADLGVYDEPNPLVELGRSGERLRITTRPPRGPAEVRFVFDLAGRTATAAGDEFPPKAVGPLSVIESSKTTQATAGLYYADSEGSRHLVARDHWHDNYALTRDGEFVVTTTWDGEVLAWSTREKEVVFRAKIAPHYGHLAYDDRHDRFLLGDASSSTTKLRALRRVPR